MPLCSFFSQKGISTDCCPSHKLGEQSQTGAKHLGTSIYLCTAKSEWESQTDSFILGPCEQAWNLFWRSSYLALFFCIHREIANPMPEICMPSWIYILAFVLNHILHYVWLVTFFCILRQEKKVKGWAHHKNISRCSYKVLIISFMYYNKPLRYIVFYNPLNITINYPLCLPSFMGEDHRASTWFSNSLRSDRWQMTQSDFKPLSFWF